MRVLLDATSGARPDLSGIGRFVHELIRALAATGEVQLVLGVRGSKWRQRRQLPQPAAVTRVRRIVDWLAPLQSHPYDLAHGLDARRIRARGPRQLVTLHDLFALEFDDLADPGFRQKKLRRYRDIAERCDRILCVSETTRRQFIANFADAAAKTATIHHGVSDRCRPCCAQEIAEVRARLQLKRPYFLFVGLLNSRKNVAMLLRAFDRFSERHPDIDLALAGRPSHGFDEIERAWSGMRQASRVRFLQRVDDADLPALYSGCVALTFPSRAEGFGLPILEAFACGARVLSSDLEVLREVGGDELRTVASFDAEAWTEALAKIALAAPDEAARSRRIAHAARFSWDACARRHLQEYRIALA